MPEGEGQDNPKGMQHSRAVELLEHYVHERDIAAHHLGLAKYQPIISEDMTLAEQAHREFEMKESALFAVRAVLQELGFDVAAEEDGINT